MASTTSPAPDAPATEQPGKRRSTLGFFLRLALIAWVLRALLLEPFYIPSGSMLPTMAIGDYLFVEKWPFGYSRFSFPWGFPPIAGRWLERLPARGDVIVFKPSSSDSDTWVKRVIGLPGDTVEVRDGAVVLNGAPVTRAALGLQPVTISPNSPCRTIGAPPREILLNGQGQCIYPTFRETLPGGRSYLTLDQADGPADHFGPITVPADNLFVMGDNRDDSEDSRFSMAEGGVGFLPVERIVGRAGYAFWSTDGSASYLKPWTWFSALRAKRLGTRY